MCRMNMMSVKSNDDEHPSSEEREEENGDGLESVGDEECWTAETFQTHTPCPYPKVDMGAFKLHPRLRSLALSPLNDSSDPVNEHIIVAEKTYRDSLPTPPKNTVWFKYIENATLEEQFMLKKKELSEAGFAEEILFFHGTTTSTTTNYICSSNIEGGSIWSRMHMHSRGSRGGMYLSRHPNRILCFAGDLILCRVLLGPKKKSVRYEHILDLKDMCDVQGYSSLEIAPMDPCLNEIVVSSPNQILPYCIISEDDPELLQEIRRININEEKARQIKIGVIRSTAGPFSEAVREGLIQVGCVGCRRNGTGINWKGEIIVDGKISSIRPPEQDIKLLIPEDTERDGLKDSSNNGGGYFSSLRTFFHSNLFPLFQYFYRDAKKSEIKRMEEGKKDENQ